MAFPPVPFQEWFLRQTSAGNAALNAYVARVKADGGVVEAIGCVPLAVWDWAAPSYVGLLDLFPNAAAAYSLRKLRAAYSGNAVRVRRSSDNTEQDIGFTTQGELDTTSLLSFVNEDVDIYTSDFSSTEDLTETNGTGAAAQSVGGVDDAYKFTLSGGSGLHQTLKGVALSGGGTATISLDYYIPSTNTAVDGIIVGIISGTTETQATTDAWTSVILSVTNFGNGNAFFRATDGGNPTIDADGDVFYLKNIVITQTTADGLVSAWYDQSLSNNATQSTAANQPKIVSGGSLVEENGKAAIDFDGVNDLFVTTRLLTDNEWAIFNVSKIDAFPTGIFTICAQHTGATVINRTVPIQVSNPNSQQTFFNNGTTYSGTHSEVANLNQTLRASLAFDDDYYLSINGDLEQVISNKSLTPLNTDFTIGALGNGVNIFNGNMQELITYSSNQSTNRVAIETNINTFYSIY